MKNVINVSFSLTVQPAAYTTLFEDVFDVTSDDDVSALILSKGVDIEHLYTMAVEWNLCH